MASEVRIQVSEVVGTNLCVASEDGQKVHDQVAGALRRGRRVLLSFLNVEALTSAFLNAAVGQLYGEFSPEQVRAGVSVVDMDPADIALLKRVVDTAKDYFKDPGRFQGAKREVLGEEDDSPSDR